MFRAVVVIPVFNHERYVATVADAVRRHGVPCILVDDGSAPTCATLLQQLVDTHPEARTLVRHSENLGKGAAVLSGLREAQRAGYTHALQIDADGQHNVDDIPEFLRLARANPDALVNGEPIFDASVPRVRLYLRYLTHFMVSVNTLTPQLRDTMCGFRVYPLERTVALANRVYIGRRMDFDTEIMVRLDWDGVPVLLHPTRVRYPADGVSHFRLWSDNVRITLMHTRLFLQMLPRSPSLLLRRVKRHRAERAVHARG